MAKEYFLTEWEVTEFIEQVSQRPRLWFGKDKLWVRRRNGINHFAMKFQNGLPLEMNQLHVKLLDESESLEEVERLVDRLIRKFTSYGWRKEVEGYIRSEFEKKDSEINIETIAKHITGPGELSLAHPDRTTTSSPSHPAPPERTSGESSQSDSEVEERGLRGVEYREGTSTSKPPQASPRRILSKQMLRLLK